MTRIIAWAEAVPCLPSAVWADYLREPEGFQQVWAYRAYMARKQETDTPQREGVATKRMRAG